MARPPVKEKRTEEQALLHFVDSVDKCIERRAIADGTLRGSSLTIRFTPDALPEIDADHGDEDDMRSLMGDFRKLLASGSDAEFYRICNIVERRVTDVDVELTAANRGNRSAWKEALRGEASLMFYDRKLSGVDFLNVWMNGDFFHSNPIDEQLYRDIQVVPATAAMFQQMVNSTILDCLDVAFAERNVVNAAFDRGYVARP